MRDLTFTISRIEYGSLEVVLSVLGLKSGALLPLIAGALEVYGAEALHRTLPGGRVPPEVSADVAGSTSPTAAAEPKPAGTEGALSRVWLIANSSLLVPVLLAMAVVYVAFSALSDEANELRKERVAMQASIADFSKAVMEQNRHFTQTAVQSAGDVAAVMKDLRKLQMDQLAARPPVPEKDADRTARDPQHRSGGCWLAVWCGW